MAAEATLRQITWMSHSSRMRSTSEISGCGRSRRLGIEPVRCRRYFEILFTPLLCLCAECRRCIKRPGCRVKKTVNGAPLSAISPKLMLTSMIISVPAVQLSRWRADHCLKRVHLFPAHARGGGGCLVVGALEAFLTQVSGHARGLGKRGLLKGAEATPDRGKGRYQDSSSNHRQSLARKKTNRRP